MKEPTLTEIRQNVESKEGAYRKLKIKINCCTTYYVNGATMTKAEMIERYKRGEL